MKKKYEMKQMNDKSLARATHSNAKDENIRWDDVYL